MMTTPAFRDYYTGQYRGDLESLLAHHPQPADHVHEDRMIQWYMISPASLPVAAWPERQRKLFATALYFTILADQVAYTFYRPMYSEWRQLTWYPKLRGGCPGGCQSHADPQAVFRMMARRTEYYDNGPSLNCRVELREATPVMEAEVRDFFMRHMPGIDWMGFWARCRTELNRYLAEPAD